EPTLVQIAEEFNSRDDLDSKYHTYPDSKYLIENDPDDSEIEWVTPLNDSELVSTPDTTQDEISLRFPEYRNDIHLHEGYHWCSCDCEGAIFLCGNSFYNSNGGVTKCGYCTPYLCNVAHECEGSKDLYFQNKDSRSYRPYRKSNKSKSRKSHFN